jgi:hypothetical protein
MCMCVVYALEDLGISNVTRGDVDNSRMVSTAGDVEYPVFLLRG